MDIINEEKKKTIIVKVPLRDTGAMDVIEKAGRECNCSKEIEISENSGNCEINVNLRTSDILVNAAECLRNGGLVAFPTETVYGLGADGLNPEASKKIYTAKGRPSDNPLIVHIADLNELAELAYVNEKAYTLAHAFWPGPLTIILPKKDIVPRETTGGLDTVAVRMPSHPVSLELIRQSGVYVAAPSANISGRPSPTNAEHVIEDMDGRIDYIIDGGPVGIGIESTIVDLSGDVPTILRPGYITREMIQDMIGEVRLDPALENPVESASRGIHPKAPGMKYTHYAPRGELTLVEAADVSSDVYNYKNAGTGGNEDDSYIAETATGSNEDDSYIAETATVSSEDDSHIAETADEVEGHVKSDAAQVDMRVVDRIRELAAEKRNAGFKVGIMASRETIALYEGYADSVICVGDRSEQTTVAAGLYAALRKFDEQGAEYIYAESFRGEGLSYAIMNRLLKAAGQRVIRV